MPEEGIYMKDAVGNDLKAGDLVMLSLDRPLIFGRVVEVQEGNLITGLRKGGGEVRPSRVIIASNHTIDCDPRTVVGSVMALRDPTPPVIEGEPVADKLPN
jgi:uncharacterized Zn ribbon protein